MAFRFGGPCRLSGALFAAYVRFLTPDLFNEGRIESSSGMASAAFIADHGAQLR